VKQIVVNNIIRPTRRETETLSFSFNLGPLKIICVANIPEEGKTSAPTYIKLQLPDENGEYPRKEQRQARDNDDTEYVFADSGDDDATPAKGDADERSAGAR